MAYPLPDLPYDYDALAPAMSPETLRFHHDKHHAAYVKVLNELTAGKPPAPLEEVVRSAEPGKLFNNAAQAWNHGFFWESMGPQSDKPQGDLAAAIDRDFGSITALKEKFVAEGVGHFASGWVWLVAQGGTLKVISTHDAGCVVTQPGVAPVLVCDLWEHAYYLDKQNDRKAFLETWFDVLANWRFAQLQWDAAQGRGSAWAYPKP